jgi:hypothetical protein
MATATVTGEMEFRNSETESMAHDGNAVFARKERDSLPQTESVPAGNVVGKAEMNIARFRARYAGEECQIHVQLSGKM